MIRQQQVRTHLCCCFLNFHFFKFPSCWNIRSVWMSEESEEARWSGAANVLRVERTHVYQIVSCLCQEWIMDELVIINPAYSGSAAWRCGGTDKGRTESRRDDLWAGWAKQHGNSLCLKGKNSRTERKRRQICTFGSPLSVCAAPVLQRVHHIWSVTLWKS